MFLSDRTMKLLLESGMDTDKLVRLMQSLRADEEAALPPSSPGAVRQKRWREKRLSTSQNVSDETSVTEETETVSGPFLSPLPPAPPTTSNLSGYPPIPPKNGPEKPGPEGFEASWLAYPHVQGRSSEAKALAEWRKLPAADRKGLLAAIGRFRPNVEKAHGNRGAPAMDRWLRDGKYRDWLTGPKATGPLPDPWTGPPEFRSAVVEAKGDAWTASWLDGCGWRNGPDRVILARTGMAADRLRRDLSGLLIVHDMTVKHERRP